jgi:dTDP-4-amino-4,6-dideoxygalactose transaminase
MGEGGALLIRDENDIEDAEILREKGTNRSKFFRGQIDKYTWVNHGSSYLPSDMNAAYLLAQLECAQAIFDDRMRVWNAYRDAFAPLQAAGRVDIPSIPDDCAHNAHMFYLKLSDLADRSAFIDHMGEHGIMCTFHYVPLHSSPAGQRFGRFHGADEFTTGESERLVRLPMYYGLEDAEIATIIQSALEYLEPAVA